MLDHDPHWKDYITFYEFFDADTGRGLGASHQCGWTGLIAKMIHDTGYTAFLPRNQIVVHCLSISFLPLGKVNFC